MNIKIASWNIAGGREISSLSTFDYKEENIDYFYSKLFEISPDIVCLQESHYKNIDKSSFAKKLSDLLDMNLIVESINSPSHIDKDYSLSNAIISSNNVISVKEEYFPDPSVPLYWKDGREAITHKKNIQVAKFDGYNAANNQMLPIEYFGHSYVGDPVGEKLARDINEVMERTITTPVLWCGDFIHNDPSQIYKHIRNLRLRDALPDTTTRPNKDGRKSKLDHIYYSPEFTLISSEVIVTNTDHYLCVAEFEI